MNFHMISGDSTDHDPPPTAVAVQKQIRPSETAQTMDIYMASDGHAGRSHQYGLQWQYNL